MLQSISGLLWFHLTSITHGDRRRDERGDVPGWVMVTLMTALVIAALLPIIKRELEGLLTQAFASVK